MYTERRIERLRFVFGATTPVQHESALLATPANLIRRQHELFRNVWEETQSAGRRVAPGRLEFLLGGQGLGSWRRCFHIFHGRLVSIGRQGRHQHHGPVPVILQLCGERSIRGSCSCAALFRQRLFQHSVWPAAGLLLQLPGSWGDLSAAVLYNLPPGHHPVALKVCPRLHARLPVRHGSVLRSARVEAAAGAHDVTKPPSLQCSIPGQHPGDAVRCLGHAQLHPFISLLGPAGRCFALLHHVVLPWRSPGRALHAEHVL